MSKLKAILQEEALAEINKILAEADSKAESLIKGITDGTITPPQ